MWPRHIVPFLAVVIMMGPQAAAQEREPAESPVAWRQAFKSTVLLSLPPTDAAPEDRFGVTGFWRIRTEVTGLRNRPVAFDLAIEHRVRAWSGVSVPASGVLPPPAAAPFRVRQLDWQVAAGPQATWQVEIDRAALQAQLPRTVVTVGRQAIGWGRGVMFNAIDLFAPFAPLEVDREWRRGIDAVRADVKVTDRTSFDIVAAFGDSLDRSAFAARVRGYGARADLELVAGRRARDAFGGVAASAPLGDAEVHAEMAVIDLPQHKAVTVVAGGSYQFAVGNGLLTFAEYRYAGRGDTMASLQHVAATTTYECSPELTFALQWLQSMTDGSGTIVPSLTVTFTDRWSLLVSGYGGYGELPRGVLAQLRVYR